MVIWLNGTFGVGKTTTAEQLRPVLPGFRIFDPETVGYMLRPNLADHPVTDFQHWAAWRSLVVATAVELIKQTGEDLIAPQTVLDEQYMTEMITGLGQHGQAVFHVLLDADVEVLYDRINSSVEAHDWRRAHVQTYVDRQPWMQTAADLVLDTTSATPCQVASATATAVGERRG